MEETHAPGVQLVIHAGYQHHPDDGDGVGKDDRHQRESHPLRQQAADIFRPESSRAPSAAEHDSPGDQDVERCDVGVQGAPGG